MFIHIVYSTSLHKDWTVLTHTHTHTHACVQYKYIYIYIHNKHFILLNFQLFNYYNYKPEPRGTLTLCLLSFGENAIRTPSENIDRPISCNSNWPISIIIILRQLYYQVQYRLGYLLLYFIGNSISLTYGSLSAHFTDNRLQLIACK